MLIGVLHGGHEISYPTLPEEDLEIHGRLSGLPRQAGRRWFRATDLFTLRRTVSPLIGRRDLPERRKTGAGRSNAGAFAGI